MEFPLEPPTLNQLRQDDQYHRHGNRPADARGDLRKGHELHPIGRGENGDIAGAARIPGEVARESGVISPAIPI